MLQIKLGEKTFHVDYVSAIALREIGEPMKILNRSEEEAHTENYGRDLDVLVNWFCLLFGNQFTAADVYESYPSDRLLHDIALSVLAVKENVSQALQSFPTKPAAEETGKSE